MDSYKNNEVFRKMCILIGYYSTFVCGIYKWYFLVRYLSKIYN